MNSNAKDVLGWLLEGDNPSVEYLTLRNLLDYAEDDPRVLAARQKIMQVGPVPMILRHLNDEGHFRDAETVREYGEERTSFGYLPKYQATAWQLLLFAELGADQGDPRVRRTCDYVLEHSWMPNGLFSMVGNQNLTPCFQGNMLYALAKLGCGGDPRVTEAFEVLVEYTRFDDGQFETPNTWPYRGKKDRCSGSHSCYAGCLKALKAITAIPPEKWNTSTREFVSRGAEYFLTHHIYQASHSTGKLLHREIDEIVFPTFVYGDFLEVLTILLQLGVNDPRMQGAVELLNAKQLPNGRWRLERDVPRMHVRLGRRHHESKWATYRARYALKLWNSFNNN
jgi:hypothetical protein